MPSTPGAASPNYSLQSDCVELKFTPDGLLQLLCNTLQSDCVELKYATGEAVRDWLFRLQSDCVELKYGNVGRQQHEKERPSIGLCGIEIAMLTPKYSTQLNLQSDCVELKCKLYAAVRTRARPFNRTVWN